jgi:putative transposase
MVVSELRRRKHPMKRVPPSTRTKEAIRSLLQEGSGDGDPKSELMKLGVRRIVEEALEQAVGDLLGRDYYERRSGRQGYRNGQRTGRLKTAEGEVLFSSPQVKDVDQEALQELRELLRGRTEELQRLGLEMFARGCSTRDIEEIFRTDDGRSLLSRTAVSEITEALWQEYEEFTTRDLSDVHPLYLFADGIAERLRPGAKREAVLVAWAITWEGRKVLLHVVPGTKESTECCKELYNDMKRRGLEDPILVVTDGAPGIIRATEECFPTAKRQRCLAHKMRNLASKCPQDIWQEFKAAAKAAYEAPSPSMAKALHDDLVERYAKVCPSAVKCFQEDFDACIAHLSCPPAHRRLIRTTNLLERLFLEERRRLNAANTMFGERAVLKLMYAALIRASGRWRGMTITDLERAQLRKLQEELEREFKKGHEPVKLSEKRRPSPSRFSSKNRT